MLGSRAYARKLIREFSLDDGEIRMELADSVELSIIFESRVPAQMYHDKETEMADEKRKTIKENNPGERTVVYGSTASF